MALSSLPAQEKPSDSLFILDGSVLFSADSVSIPDVHVLNLSRGTGTVSSYDGSFIIRAQHMDTILFSCVGYQDYYLYVNTTLVRKDLLVFMQTDTVFMKEVLISPLGPRRFFKLLFLQTKLPEEKGLTFDLNIPMLKNDPGYVPQTGIRVTGPVQALYNAFNKSSRLQRKLQKNRKNYSKYLQPVVADSLIYPDKK
jgi:hypothetical protein